MTDTAPQYAKLYLKEIVRLHGILVFVISDRGPQFIAHFLQSFQEGLGTSVNLSTAFHPQTDGQDEMTIQMLEDMLRACLEFKEGDQVFLKVTPMKGVMRFGKKGKLSPRFIGPYRILKRIGEVAYKLELPASMTLVHPVFHVSILQGYVPDPAHIISPEVVEINDGLTYDEEPVEILDRQVHRLRTKDIASVKMLWHNHDVEEATWEVEEDMKI
ncbi:uncharacterized protein LOC142173570 [Nicotiana tabacum]|uniref:Uncharacterized protein LOC142173570 n=1 Tax=Nicotiana tabacum TaxID=4097 RepID=A0AC58TDK6_TOBAC